MRQGDSIASLAARCGVPWEKIWNDSRNAKLRERRKDPNILLPGDVVFLPGRERKKLSSETERRHRFVLKGATARLRVRLLVNDQPRVREPYELNIGGTFLSGQTDADGWIDQPIAPDVGHVVLLLADGTTHELTLGHLDPIDEVSGVQGRLKGLAFYGGRIDNVPGPETEDALRRFQSTRGLPETGKLDQPTKDALVAAYGC